MHRISGPLTFRLLTLVWPALVLGALYLFPGQDDQRELERRLRAGPQSVDGPPVPEAAARKRGSGGRGNSGIRMFWEETGEGQFRGEIYIPPEELSPAQEKELQPAPGQELRPAPKEGAPKEGARNKGAPGNDAQDTEEDELPSDTEPRDPTPQ